MFIYTLKLTLLNQEYLTIANKLKKKEKPLFSANKTAQLTMRGYAIKGRWMGDFVTPLFLYILSAIS